jgi:hypothetical protein
MALGFIITLERPFDGSDALLKPATGKALARESARIESAARRKGVTGISGFLSEDQSRLVEQMKADGFDPSKMRIPPERWFTAGDGLVTVRALAAYVTANLNDFKQPNPILRDLKAADAVLAKAESNGVRFHFTGADV